MGRYKYYIETENGQFYFGLFPNNQNSYPMGRSGLYSSRQEAERALDSFKNLLHRSNDIVGLFDVVKVSNGHKFKLRDNEYNISFYRVHPYKPKSGLHNGLEAIKRNYNAELEERD